MYTKSMTERLGKFMKKWEFVSHKVECGQLLFVRKSGEDFVIQEFIRKSPIHREWRKLEEELLSDGPEWAQAGNLPALPKNITLVNASKRLEAAKPGTLDFAFWWWKILEKMRDLRDGEDRKGTFKAKGSKS